MGTEENVTHQPLTIRLIRPSVVVLCGPASCGKSTFAARHFRPTQVISSDRARGLICDDERDQRFQTQAFALVHFLVEQRLGINRLCVVDSTALTPPARKGLLDLAKKFKVPCSAFVFDLPLELCATRDESRERSVGRLAIERQYELFERVKAGIQQEGFDQIHLLREPDLERVQIEILFRPVQTSLSTVPFEQRRFTARPAQPTGNRQGIHPDAKTPSAPPTAEAQDQTPEQAAQGPSNSRAR